MGRLFLVEYNEFPEKDFILCSVCKTRIGLVEDYITSLDDGRTEVFNEVFNVVVDTEKHYKQENGRTVADTYCVKCGMLLGMKLIIVPNPSVYRERRFLMRTNKLVYWNNDPLIYEEDEGANHEQDHNQDGGANEQDHEQDLEANEQVPNEQDLEANEQDADQDEDANGQNNDEDGDAPMN